MKPIRVLSVASEIYPLIKTGGLADVVGALPTALKAEGIETRTVVPGYPDVLNALGTAEEVLQFSNFYGGPARVLGGAFAGLDLFALDAPHLFARPGNPYTGPDGYRGELKKGTRTKGDHPGSHITAVRIRSGLYQLSRPRTLIWKITKPSVCSRYLAFIALKSRLRRQTS